MENKKSFSNIVYMFGAIYAILGILTMFIKPPTADSKDTSMVILGFVSLFLFIAIPIIAVWYYKKEGYQVTLGKALKLGVLLGLFGGTIVGIYAYIYYSYVNPGAIDQVLELSRNMLEETGKFDEKMIEMQMETTRKLFVPMQLFGQIFSGLLYGVIGGLIGGLFYKTPTENY
jgi:hypothetical protein